VRHQVLATFEEGGPAVVTFTRGKGRATYVAASLPPRAMAAVLRWALAVEKVERLVRLAGKPEDGWGLECRSAKLGGRLVASVWNTTADARYISLQARGITTAANLSTGEPVEVRPAGEAAIAGAVRVAPFATVLVELAPAP
jgi:hypothetical protein